MDEDVSARLLLPLLRPGQAQKEVFHNEALALVDIAMQAVVVSIGTATPPASPVPGECWIVGASPTGAWTGHAASIAGWTSGGWRFVPAVEGMMAWSHADNVQARYLSGSWTIGDVRGRRLVIDGQAVTSARRAAIADPAGGTTSDTEARIALTAILAALRGHGLIAT